METASTFSGGDILGPSPLMISTLALSSSPFCSKALRSLEQVLSAHWMTSTLLLSSSSVRRRVILTSLSRIPRRPLEETSSDRLRLLVLAGPPCFWALFAPFPSSEGSRYGPPGLPDLPPPTLISGCFLSQASASSIRSCFGSSVPGYYAEIWFRSMPMLCVEYQSSSVSRTQPGSMGTIA